MPPSRRSFSNWLYGRVWTWLCSIHQLWKNNRASMEDVPDVHLLSLVHSATFGVDRSVGTLSLYMALPAKLATQAGDEMLSIACNGGLGQVSRDERYSSRVARGIGPALGSHLTPIWMKAPFSPASRRRCRW